MDLLRMVQWEGEAMELQGFTLQFTQQTQEQSTYETLRKTFLTYFCLIWKLWLKCTRGFNDLEVRR